ncbi:MAG: hypothetical protein M1821_001918 [Bathelium mastoideum]|nr:MAG: hypothetical protein M1821_001918 [Bathelium mastoideum]KAI9692428.1 MAG: hypothetical protein M1822_006659 [Bathelium mastoideum]
MKEAIVSAGPTVKIVDSEIPKPNADQVVIKVVVSGSNPKDWKVPEWMGTTLNQGDDIAGTISAVGENVTEFKVGDRVGAFHEMRTPGGSYAEYALAWAHTTFHIPKTTTYEEAAAIPLAAMTAAVGLYVRLGLPEPWKVGDKDIPLVIYGGSSAVGAYAIQLAQRSKIHPLIVVAGGGAPYVETLIDRTKGDTIVDYRKGNQAVVQGIKDELKGKTLEYAFDATSEKGSYQNICQVLASNGHITLVLPNKEDFQIPATVHNTLTMVGSVHGEDKDFGHAFFRYIGKGLHDGWFKPHPQEIQKGGLEGVQGALQKLKDGQASAIKYVFRIADTPGISS